MHIDVVAGGEEGDRARLPVVDVQGFDFGHNVRVVHLLELVGPPLVLMDIDKKFVLGAADD